jgi:hypothetical protein
VKKESDNSSKNGKSIHAGTNREMHKIDEALFCCEEKKQG